jgi:hypothetical protein
MLQFAQGAFRQQTIACLRTQIRHRRLPIDENQDHAHISLHDSCPLMHCLLAGSGLSIDKFSIHFSQ